MLIPILSTRKQREQAAALPVRPMGGAVEVGLVTTRGTGRWVIPKGWIKSGDTAEGVARQEAREEAGWLGRLDPVSIGSFVYEKRLASLTLVRCRVTVFVLHVDLELDDWREHGERQRAWLSPAVAAERVSDAGLAHIIRRSLPFA